MPISRRAEADAPIYVTMGDPSGVGPEVAVKAYFALAGRIGLRPLKLVGDPRAFLPWGELPDDAFIPASPVKTLTPGAPDPENALATLAAIEISVKAALDGTAAALVTAPIHKASLIKAGFKFAGHTDYLAHLTDAPRAVMMLAGQGLRVIPLTVHVPYRMAPDAITETNIVATARIVFADLARFFGLPHPRLAVAGLNPHAGESGEIGREEIDIIAPAIEILRREGHAVLGPLPPDTMFHAEARARYDAALCMYHDQALIPLKTLAFWEGVNITLGLPIVRTSPDHGTALDIAGTGKADERSMIAAIRMAAEMADVSRS